MQNQYIYYSKQWINMLTDKVYQDVLFCTLYWGIYPLNIRCILTLFYFIIIHWYDYKEVEQLYEDMTNKVDFILTS